MAQQSLEGQNMAKKDLSSLEPEMLVCTQCGYCRSVCPIFEDLGWDSSVARGRVILAYGML